MSNETDLGWLARNVHNWPAGHQGWCYVISNRDGTKGVATSLIGQVDCPRVRIEKQEWLARRAGLQNKPSWDDFGESAKFMAQDSDGAWMAFESEPAAKYHVWGSMRGWCGYAREGRDRCRGEVLGDWRDTLEKRPDMHKNLEKIDTSVEHVQKNVKSMHEWLESGDLPPVGIEIEAWFDDGRECWHKANVIGYSLQEERVLAVSLKGTHDRKLVWVHHFRPIRAERDALVEVLTKVKAQGVDIIGVADAILAAGFSRRDK